MAEHQKRELLRWLLIGIGVMMSVSLILDISSSSGKMISQGQNKVYARIQPMQTSKEPP